MNQAPQGRPGAHTRDDEAVREHKNDAALALQTEEAERRLTLQGPNALRRTPPTPRSAALRRSVPPYRLGRRRPASGPGLVHAPRMRMTVEKFHELAVSRRASSGRTGARYSSVERRWAVEYARQAGLNANRAARALGISDVTMRMWLRTVKPTGTLRPVVVTPDELAQRSEAQTPSKSAPMLMLRTAHGHEVGPLDVEAAAALLRALS